MPMLFGIVFHHPELDKGKSVIPEGDDECPSCIEKDDIEGGIMVTTKLTDLGETARATLSMKDKEAFSRDEHARGDVMGDDASPQDEHAHCDICEEEHGLSFAKQGSVSLVEKAFIDMQLCASILLGDGFHNFADGMFIAASFKASCDTATPVSITAVTIIHEIAQELADFILLTRHVGLSTSKAFLLNFISGLSVSLGGIVFLAGNPSDEATGVILGMAGGVYMNIAACETIPRIESIIRTRVDRIWALLFVIIGTVPVGLILLNHHHCE